MIPLRVSVWLIGRYRNFALLIASVHLQDLPAFLIYQPLFYDLPYVQSKLQRKKDDQECPLFDSLMMPRCSMP